MPSVRVADLGDLRSGAAVVVRVGERRIALFNVDGEICALDNVCPHAGGPIGLGDLAGGVVTCPLHGWQFDARSGACITVPGERVARHATRIDGTAVYVDLEPGPSDDLA